jgi:Tol biopolymer transport system component
VYAPETYLGRVGEKALENGRVSERSCVAGRAVVVPATVTPPARVCRCPVMRRLPRAPARSIAATLVLAALTLLATTTLLVGCGSGVAHKSPFRWSDQFLAWSPNSKLILFSSDRPRHKQSDLYVIASTGNHLRRLTDDKLNEANGHPVFLSNRQVAFTAHGRRHVIPIDRRGETLLKPHARQSRARQTDTHGCVGPTRRGRSSPDGRWVAFARHRLSGPRDWYGATAVDVYLMRCDGSDLHRVATVGPATTFSPAWSPNSRAFAFEAPPNGGRSVISQGTTISEVYIVPVPGAKAIQVSHDPGSCCAVWSPDGREIAFQSSGSGGYSGLTLVRPDGSDQQTLHQGLDVSTMTWVLGGRKLLVRSGTGEYLVNRGNGELHLILAQPNANVFISPDETKAVIEEQGGPLTYWGCCFSSPRYVRIDLVDLNTGRLRHLTQ